jgi:hypothetical protein
MGQDNLWRKQTHAPTKNDKQERTGREGEEEPTLTAHVSYGLSSFVSLRRAAFIGCQECVSGICFLRRHARSSEDQFVTTCK